MIGRSLTRLDALIASTSSRPAVSFRQSDGRAG